MDDLTIKWLHVLFSTVLFGTGTGSAFQRLRALAARAQAGGALALPVAWSRWVAAWVVLGAIALVALLPIYHRMVAKRLPFA